MAKYSMEQLVASTIRSREDPPFPAHGVNTTLPSIYKYVIVLTLKGVVFLHDLLNSCTILEYLTSSFVLSSRSVILLNGVVFDLHLLTPHVASLFVANARSRRVVLKNSRTAPVTGIQSGRWI